MSKIKNKILIVCPRLDLKGGVANYYRTIKNNYSNDEVEISYFYLNSRGKYESRLRTIFSLFRQYLSFFKSLSKKDKVIINPSLQKNALPRDFIFFLISKLFRKDVTILIHGWDLDYKDKISNSTFLKIAYRSMFSNSRVFALANEFCDYINDLCRKEVAQRTVTFADPQLFVEFDSEKEFKGFDFLYMSRITKEKGCLEAIDIFEEITKFRPDARLNICGSGDYLEHCKEYANKKNIGDRIRFLGFVDSHEKVDVLANTNITLFPTKHGEGLPITLVESMHAGHVIISSNSGGIKDVFKGTDNLILDLSNSKEWVNKASNYVLSLTENEFKEISKANIIMAKGNHGIKRVFEKILGVKP
ncbi:glycosyltransferase family 4 protein [Vibrio owensii]